MAFSIWALWPSVSLLLISNERVEVAQKEKPYIFNKSLKLGLDLKGGTDILLEVGTMSQTGENVNTEDVVDRVIEIIRNRIDQFGVTEPLIAKQGAKWIVVQLPSIRDPEIAKDLIGKTALLEFKIVDTSDESCRILDLFSKKKTTSANFRRNLFAYPDIKVIMPKGSSIFESKENTDYYVLGETLLTGSAIKNAKVSFDELSGQPQVLIEFNKDGEKAFANITKRNKEKQLAIVLDGVVQVAPIIHSEIPYGMAAINGSFSSLEEARLLATILRAGALPASVKIVEERIVGPSLGEDSIKKGCLSSLIGISSIFLFMLVYYRFSGLIVDIALGFNLMLLLAVMAYFQFTLTLPGVAGIALTLSMAVDANVLILERVREELLSGKAMRIAVSVGYRRVFWTIFDANFTTLIAAFFLFKFGTGPIKGFAATLSIGLIISMFTSVVLTKLIYELLFREKFLLRIKI
ncbi:MAG: protein translocase subunit SecD [Endomicrobium sp.]|nr:protein translocase subunit SecD [Endomicrobium sp.]